jgi:hypothetical protein
MGGAARRKVFVGFSSFVSFLLKSTPPQGAAITEASARLVPFREV